MTHAKYHTEGIVMRSFERGEADRGFLLFTRGLGVVYAKARGVRHHESKLRFALQEFSHSGLSLVRGREMWRLTNAEPRGNWFPALAQAPKTLAATRRVAMLALRLGGEEANEGLFDTLLEGFRYGARADERESANLETLLALRVLHASGLLGNPHYFGYLLASPSVNDMLVFEAGRIRPRAVAEINRSLASLQV